MKEDVAMKWADALESGKYEQGTLSLRENNRYCCLGVLCDISGQGKWVADRYGVDENSCKTFAMPKIVLNWSGVSSCNGLYLGQKGRERALSSYNDGTNGHEKTSFKEIAAWIRKYYKAL